MSDVWRICVVEGDASLNQNLVNALRKDGYVVQGVMKSADAMRVLWSEEYDVVICNLSLPGADGFELLRWLRAYRSTVRPIVLGDAVKTGNGDQRLQALEGGAISYLEKPVDLRLLKDELRRLLQQTGFTASLDSFDLLDVIQIITMTRKSITLLINTGLEERGTLRFHNGDLVWAEYGLLRGEEAFFALAAHKNGTVTQHLSNEQFVTNVTQPLSRLIFQALQYRTKYANKQQPLGLGADIGQGQVLGQGTIGQGSSGQGTIGQGQAQSLRQSLLDEVDDSPFLFGSEEMGPNDAGSVQQVPQVAPAFSAPQEPYPSMALDLHMLRENANTSKSSPRQGEMSSLENTSANPLSDASAQMPSWLTDQPTSTHVPISSPAHFSSFNQTANNQASNQTASQASVPPTSPSFPDEMQPLQAMPSAQVPIRMTDQLPKSQQSAAYKHAFAAETEERRTSSSQWSQEPQRPSSSPQHRLAGQSGVFERPQQGRQSSPDALRENNPMQSPAPVRTPRQLTAKNHAALVSALQTLGYSIAGFIAAAVIDVDTHPLAQVAIDDTDISQVWQLLSLVQRSAFNALQSEEWGLYEETIMTTASRHVLIRTTGGDKNALLVLITTRETPFTVSLEVMANVESAITGALR